ncbi:MAG: histidine phosphatase family protein [Microthrixaceae bacterium]
MTDVLVVRHGQSEWNADGRWQGQANPDLTSLGREQARLAAEAVGAVDAIFASPLIRAAMTATIISELIGIGPVVLAEGLMERNAGEWQGLTRSEIESGWPGYLDARKRPPGWEDDALVRSRAFAALEEIAGASGDGHVLAVAHAGIIYAIEEELGATWERLANLAGRWLRFEHGQWHLGDRVHLLTDETIPDQI